MSTESIIYLANYLVLECQYDFFLPGKTLGDPVENFHSSIRHINKNPTPMNYMRYAKVICTSQLLSSIPSSSVYEQDKLYFLSDLKSMKAIAKSEETPQEDDNKEFVKAQFIGSEQEKAIISHLAGYVLKKTILTKSSCSTCTKYFVNKSQESEDKNLNQIIVQKEYKEGALVHPSQMANKIFINAEALFKKNRETWAKSKNQVNILATKISLSLLEDFKSEAVPQCHFLLMLRRFIRLRLFKWGDHMMSKLEAIHKRDIVNQSYGSKSTRIQTAEQTQ